jgi:hypothetical protein
MLEKYNNEIKKLIKLIIMLGGTYYAIINIPEIQASYNGLLKLMFIIGILFIILENYYPSLSI